ncbi:disulfide bond formation protein DsbA [Pseudothauera nasutitermitis]|uniref:Disulfide bond formation protein DsbA n=1 Tax=Pseudothauera nasutitermitis TaxID=2565930 RepID=A0A4S4AXM6_9RHOO|nr:thioredoxin domain-containing protein [Pseudothauera nasutitermitis]THF64863.1 disulfide bond formation protein DsbA [Pseudothauera nasutitermitis]
MPTTTRSSRGALHRLAWPAAIVALALLLLLVALRPSAPPADNAAPLPAPEEEGETAAPSRPAGPPWHHGGADARFTLILYADLECPFCKAYYPELVAWIERHPDARLQWHHLPLSVHEPAASQLASLAECAGEAGGHAAYWQAVTWIYHHTRGDGEGLPENARYPGQTEAVQACVESGRTLALIQAQAREGTRDGITATPTLRLRDDTTGQTLLLHGPVEGDALLSALDLLTSGESPSTESESLSAVPDGDMPR